MNDVEAGYGKVLEVGGVRLVSRGREQFVRFIDTSFSTVVGSERKSRMWRILKEAITLFIEIRRIKYGLIVFRCFGRFIWRTDHSCMMNVLRWLMGQFLRVCVMRRRAHTRLVIIDLVDEMTIDSRDLWLLKRCDLYFKRELGQNVWSTLQRVQPRHGEYNSMPANPRFQSLGDKFRPISIGITGAHLTELRERQLWAAQLAEKKYDVFFAGAIEHSSVREKGIRLLERLQHQGCSVYLATHRIPQQQFDELLAASWLCWSPEGSGWDCYRHYEACLAGSVPVINFPTIQRYAPLIHGKHCFYYAIEDDDLVKTIQAALSDKPRLSEMALAARQHVLEHHTCERVGDYVLMESLSARSPSLSRRTPAAAGEANASRHLVRHSLGTRDEGGSKAKVNSP